jgi:hypothetical protein
MARLSPSEIVDEVISVNSGADHRLGGPPQGVWQKLSTLNPQLKTQTHALVLTQKTRISDQPRSA